MKKPIVNQDTCIGCGTCIALCPGSFKWNDNSKVDGIFPPGEDAETLESAREICPVASISFAEVE